MKYKLAFIGFGEAAYYIAKGLKQEGMDQMIAYDVMQNDGGRGHLIRTRADEAGIALAESPETAFENADFVVSLTSPAVCVEVAESVIPCLTSGQVYVDMNSSSPADMTKVDALPRTDGVGFCDAAVLGSVPKSGHKVKMYLSGGGAQVFYDTMIPYHMTMKVLDAPVGGASACKMFKSVFSKGLPQLIIECYVPAAAYGVLNELVDLTKNTFADQNIEEYANDSLFRTLIHAKRRAVETVNCAETVETLGFDASISRAAAAKLKQLAACRYDERIAPGESPGLISVIEMLLRDIRANNSENGSGR
jgi:3-hydroxyisobutyrate dehydrogenase-like beta-hydroxyacid dehydrogenase